MDWLLSQFGKNLREARKHHQAFVEGPDPWTLEDPGKSPVGGFILGGLDFVNWVKETFLFSEPTNKKDKKRQSRIKRLERRILNN